MMFPPSLDPAIRDRAFHAVNGELGVRLSDAQAFLDACRQDQAEVFGWELWVINHRWALARNNVIGQQHGWTSGVPLRAGGTAIFHGEGDAAATDEEQLSHYDFEAEIAPEYLQFARVNFTLGD